MHSATNSANADKRRQTPSEQQNASEESANKRARARATSQRTVPTQRTSHWRAPPNTARARTPQQARRLHALAKRAYAGDAARGANDRRARTCAWTRIAPCALAPSRTHASVPRTPPQLHITYTQRTAITTAAAIQEKTPAQRNRSYCAIAMSFGARAKRADFFRWRSEHFESTARMRTTNDNFNRSSLLSVSLMSFLLVLGDGFAQLTS